MPLEFFIGRPQVDFVRPGGTRLRDEMEVGIGDGLRLTPAGVTDTNWQIVGPR
jgi:hypothetical protein